MTQEAVMKYIKAGAGILACAGIVVTDEQSSAIAVGFMTVYSIVTLIQAEIKRRQAK